MTKESLATNERALAATSMNRYTPPRTWATRKHWPSIYLPNFKRRKHTHTQLFFVRVLVRLGLTCDGEYPNPILCVRVSSLSCWRKDKNITHTHKNIKYRFFTSVRTHECSQILYFFRLIVQKNKFLSAIKKSLASFDPRGALNSPSCVCVKCVPYHTGRHIF